MRLHAALIMVTIVSATWLVAVEAAELSVPVRVLPANTPARSENMANEGRPPPPTSAGLLPQYQGTHGFRPKAEEGHEIGKPFRFILALPRRLLIIEAIVLINDKPFEQIRERRIDRLLAVLRKPVVEEPAVKDDLASETPAEQSNTEEGDDTKTDEETEGPETELEPLPSTDLEARLRRYATVTGREPTRDEVRWLLTNWVDGPTLLLLNENFQRLRASQRPVFDVLDRDMDGRISVEELKGAAKTLMSCDVNQNDLVEYTEIAEVAADPRRKPSPGFVPQLLPILDATFVSKRYKRLARRYTSKDALKSIDLNADGKLDKSEIDQLKKKKPDLTITASFHSADASKSRITIVGKQSTEESQVRGSSITIPLDGILLEFSAVQSSSFTGTDQISIGAINDGYPLLPAVDPNEDGRLTIRELRGAVKYVSSFDQNQDGLSADEIPSTVRVSIGLGPTVHQHLADIRSVHPPAKASTVVAPEWFVRMDKNKDGDLSKREFLLGADQFKRLDRDKDGLISGVEANQLNKQQPKTKKDELETDSKTEE